MTGILDNIAAKAGANDSSWVDLVVNTVHNQISSIQQPEFKAAIVASVQTLVARRDDIASLGVYGLTLFLQKIATGDQEGAYIAFITTQATFQDLINGEASDAAAIIDAKQQSDAMRAKVLSITLEITVDVARALIPFLLPLII